MLDKSKSDIVGCALIFALAVAVFLYCGSLKAETAFFPKIISIIMGACCIIQIIQTVIKQRKETESGHVQIDFALIAKIFALFIGYVAVIRILGFYIATAIFLGVFLWVFGVRKVITYVLVIGIFLLMIRFLFVEFLYFRPAAPFFLK